MTGSTTSGSKSVIRLLAIDDDAQHLNLICAALADLPLEILSTTDPQKGMEIARTARPRIVIVDLVMPDLGGMEVLEKIVEMDPAAEVLLVTGHYSMESAVEAIKKGACDYLTKPVAVRALRHKIEQLLQEAQHRQRSLELENNLVEAFQFEGIIGRNPTMLEVFGKIQRIAPHFRTVLLTGDTGTGKELAARALHRRSPAANGPFSACNCSAIVETLFESELFGHVRGAFTGATHDKAGIFEQANGGTVMLDEIGDLPLPMQAKLLRVLQNHEVQRVGSGKVRKLDVRVVAATHCDLRDMVREGKFREDLYYRLSMMEIRLPSLCERPDDLPLLVRHFVKSFAAQYNKSIQGLTRRTQMLLSRHSWPGNIRELENVIGHACMITEKETIDIEDLPEQFGRMGQSGAKRAADDSFCTLEEMERRYVREVVGRVANKAQAADILGISRTKLYRFLEEKNEEKSEKSSRGVQGIREANPTDTTQFLHN